MFSLIFAFSLVFATFGFVPQPAILTQGDLSGFQVTDGFLITLSNGQEAFENTAKIIERYSDIFFPLGKKEAKEDLPIFSSLTIELSCDYSDNLSFSSDEQYTISLLDDGTGIVRVKTALALIRALETFAQAIRYDIDLDVYIIQCPVEINDHPRFGYRGLMIDTSNHFIDISALKTVVDLMSSVKLNILHLQISDVYSISLDTPWNPRVSSHSSYDSTNAVYTKEELSDLKEYAQLRGVFIIYGFTSPGNAYYAALASPKSVAQCPKSLLSEFDAYSLNPETFFEFISPLASQLFELTSDPKFVHIGGKYINEQCWLGDEKVKKWLDDSQLTTSGGFKYIMDRVSELCKQNNFTPIVWENSFSDGNYLDKDAIYQSDISKDSFFTIVSAGYKAILSYGYVLDMQSPTPTYNYAFADTWKSMYENDPFTNGAETLTDEQQKLVVGGEAIMWTNGVDSMTLENWVFPRTAAVGEKLWSSQEITTDTNAALGRLSDWSCQMKLRGYQVGPLKPSFCVTDVLNK